MKESKKIMAEETTNLITTKVLLKDKYNCEPIDAEDVIELNFKDIPEYEITTGLEEVEELANNFTENNIYYKLVRDKGVPTAVMEFFDIVIGNENMEISHYDLTVKQLTLLNLFAPFIIKAVDLIDGTKWFKDSYKSIQRVLTIDEDGFFLNATSTEEYISALIDVRIPMREDDCDERFYSILAFIMTIYDYLYKNTLNLKQNPFLDVLVQDKSRAEQIIKIRKRS